MSRESSLGFPAGKLYLVTENREIQAGNEYEFYVRAAATRAARHIRFYWKQGDLSIQSKEELKSVVQAEITYGVRVLAPRIEACKARKLVEPGQINNSTNRYSE